METTIMGLVVGIRNNWEADGTEHGKLHGNWYLGFGDITPQALLVVSRE